MRGRVDANVMQLRGLRQSLSLDTDGVPPETKLLSPVVALRANTQ